MNDTAATAASDEADQKADARRAKPPSIFRRYPGRALFTLLTFTLLGPPAGAFAFAIGRAVLGFAAGGPFEVGSIFSQGMALAFPAAFFAGLVPAVVAGALVAIAVWLNGRAGIRPSCLFAVAGGLVGAWYAQRGLAGKLKADDLPYLYLGYVIVSLAGAAACWWIANAFGIFREPPAEVR
ncbi:MAG: hypothetical protein F9K44_05005 [Hyphomicrobiaceae bacterium]|nr:MAG: hypothetical protein F9K44_05005 [Hyphomicrobiaceae bacterium]